MTHMRAIPKPAYARMQRAKKRLKAAQLAANAVLVRERDVFCQYCGSARELHAHHIRYRSQGGGHETSNLVLVCRICHELIHDKRLKVTGNADVYLSWTVTPKTVRRIA